MKAICFNFEIHQPFRLKRYRFFDIGKDHYYYDDFLNDDIMERIARNSYIPAAETLLRMIESNEGRFRCSIAMSGIAFEQFEQYAPEFIDVLKRLADTGCVEFVAQPYAYSLASLNDPEEFAAQMGDTRSLLRNGKLSDDIAFRFTDTSWPEFPLTADKYIDWIASTPAEEQIVNIFLNMETFGDMQPATSGIFAFLEALPRFAAERGIEFVTPSEAIARLKPVGELSVMHPISGADEARDISAWLGNRLQNEAFEKLYSVAERVRQSQNRALKQDWLRLQTCDHFFYMSTKRKADGIAHSMFSPYETPFAAFTNYMNVLADFLMRVQEEYPEQVGNEELNSLLLTIANQGQEIEALNKELMAMRKNAEQYNIEHRLREANAEKTPKATKTAKTPKATKAPKEKAAKTETPAAEPKKRGRKPKAAKAE